MFEKGKVIVDFSTSIQVDNMFVPENVYFHHVPVTSLLQVNVKESTKHPVFRDSKPVLFPVTAASLAASAKPEPYTGPWWFWKNLAIGWTPYDKECSLLLQKVQPVLLQPSGRGAPIAHPRPIGVCPSHNVARTGVKTRH